MACGCDVVSVASVKVEVFQALESGAGIRQRSAHVDLGLGVNLIEQCKSSLAFEAFKEGAPENLGVMVICEILKKISPALKQAQTTADSSFKPKLVWEGRAVPTGSGKIEK